jgi:hypothetical protein
LAVRIITACALAFLATGATAESPVIDDARTYYSYTYETRGSRHFCDLVTVMAKAPMVIKLTAAFITDDAKPKDHDLTVAYIVEAFVVGAAKNSNKLESKEVKVVSGRIVSNMFNSDLHASKNVDSDFGASYDITSEDSLSRFTGLVSVSGVYKLAVELENNSRLIVNVKPTPELLDAGGEWNKCSIAIMEHRPP